MIQTKDSNLTFRPLTIDDAEQYNALLRYAFQVTEQELSESGWKDDEIKQSKFPVLVRADVLGCFCEEDLVSQFAVYPLDMNIYGVRYPVGFVTSVCTYPEYTGQGIMKKLMIRSLTRMRENHRSFALLYPYSIPLYRNLGWEIISNKMTYTIKDTQVPRKLKAPGYVRRVAWDDKDFKDYIPNLLRRRTAPLPQQSGAGKNISAGMRMIPSLRSTIPLMMCRTATWSI